MIKLHRVKKRGIGYIFFKFVSDNFLNKIFYKKVEYTGLKNIDVSKPNLLSPNHQNAFMDAMVILASRRASSPTFLARSGIFNTDFFGNLFISMKILPIYRIRDGKDKLAKNDEIFNLSVEILEKNKDLVIFPEAQHTDKRSLLQLKKGLMRVAFHTAQKNDFELDLQIVPVGIYYEKYTPYRSKMLLNYGKPIAIKDYKKAFEENPKRVLLTLRNDLSESMKELAIHIKNLEHYDFFEQARELFDFFVIEKYNFDRKTLTGKFNADKKTIDILDNTLENDAETFEKIKTKVSDYMQNVKKLNLKDYLFDKPVSFAGNLVASIIWLLLLPVTILGFVDLAVPLGLPELLLKKVKDKQFHGSFRFVLSLFLPFVWGVLGFAVLWAVSGVWWIGLLFLLVQHPLMVATLELRKMWKKIVGKWRYFFNKKGVEELQKQRTEILNLFDSIS